LLIPVGNIEQFANKLVSLLHLDLESYTYLSNKCLDIGSNFSWQKIAKQTLEVFYNFLERQK
jgi:glycosyltransferase involved in cell wall biosynthesis